MIQCEIKEKENDEIESESSGVKDGGTTELHCNVCGTHLLSILCSKPDIDFDATYKAKCYKKECGNFSNEVYIKGGTSFIFPGNDTKRFCFLENFKIIDGVTILQMKEG